MKSHVNIMDSDIAYENVIVYHGSDRILKEPIYQGGKTDNDYGNGFYTTEYKDRAKSWAVLNGDPEYSFVNRYILNTSGLKIMDLNDYGILAWIAEVIANRGTSLESAEITGSRIVEMYRISTADFDIIKGYRADDSYTQVIEAFLLNQINIEEIKKLFYKGSLGNQIFLKSQKAFKQIEWKDAWQVYKDESDVTADFHARREVNQFFSARNRAILLEGFEVPGITVRTAMGKFLLYHQEGDFYE